jgi:molybdopterin synthase catalytic subunit
MRVSIRYFAAARDLAGVDHETVELDEVTMTARGLLSWIASHRPRLAVVIHRMRVAVNEDFADEDAAIRDGDEVVILPPVAGGAPISDHPIPVGERVVDVRETPLSIDECMRGVAHPSAGGICVFLGVVRDHADGAAVARLDYEAYTELARKEMRRIVEQIERENAGVRLAALHRVGQLAVGDTAVVVAASAPHRAEAFAACRAAIDRIKESVPIWKKEWGPDGTSTWVNLEEGE